jgi:hypothetical protein
VYASLDLFEVDLGILVQKKPEMLFALFDLVNGIKSAGL